MQTQLDLLLAKAVANPHLIRAVVRDIRKLSQHKPAAIAFSDNEKAIVRRFGTKVHVVRYSKREDLIGLRILGIQSGFEVEARPGHKDGRLLRLLDIDERGNVLRTRRFLRLRYNDSVHDLVCGLWSYVR